MEEETLCSCCGKGISKKLKENYQKSGLAKELWYCEKCVKDMPEITHIGKLFEKIKQNLSEENAKRFKNADISLKSLFALKLIKKGAISGGTIGHIETLKALTASKI